MGITAQAAKHGVQSGSDGFNSLADHGFGTIEKEINGKTAGHGSNDHLYPNRWRREFCDAGDFFAALPYSGMDSADRTAS